MKYNWRWAGAFGLCGMFLGNGISQIVQSAKYLNSDAASNENIQLALESFEFFGSNPRAKSIQAANLILSSGVFFIITFLAILIFGICMVFGVKFIKENYIKILILICLFIGVTHVVQWVAIGFSIAVNTSIGSDTTKQSMQSSLNTNYASKDFTSTYPVSTSFNYLFYTYQCCGVDPVNAVTTGFENSAWCSRSGSDCQTGTAKIPNICCSGITVDTLSTATTACKANLNAGTYLTTGCFNAYSEKIKNDFNGMMVNAIVGAVMQIIAFVVLIIIGYAQRKADSNASCCDNKTGSSCGNGPTTTT